MIIVNKEQTKAALPWLPLIDALDEGFSTGCEQPVRHQHSFSIPGEPDGTLLLMPAWTAGDYLGVKQILFIPENTRRNLSTVNASYQLFSSRSGEMLAAINGEILTDRRTAATSALAAKYLSRTDASHLLMVGTGRLAPSMIAAHCAVRPIDTVSIWGRDPLKSKFLADGLHIPGVNLRAVQDLPASVAEADIISCATSSTEALIQGAWLKPGVHVDLVGAFQKDMRETDSAVMDGARIFVDTENAVQSSGDLVYPLSEGLIPSDRDITELAELCRENAVGRQSQEKVTVFKSVGSALADLYAAILVFQQSRIAAVSIE